MSKTYTKKCFAHPPYKENINIHFAPYFFPSALKQNVTVHFVVYV